MEHDRPDIEHLRDTIAALKAQLIADAMMDPATITLIQTEIAYAQRLIQLKLEGHANENDPR